MSSIRFIMIGGFLGAGKTTTLARLARTYMERGHRVGLVTNDQAQNLVDTNSLKAQGFPVQEVPGACFCCKFDELVAKAKDLQEAERPDIILAEPVGSCTDLVATVVQPLKDLYATTFKVAPYVVLFKPSHGLRILRNEAAGFSPKAAYIFRKQLEEADAIVINRVDELPPAALEELKSLLATAYPNTPLVAISAKTGQSFEGLVEVLDQEGAFGQKILSIDYDTYAEGEAELGWLNASIHLRRETPFAIDEVLLEVVTGIERALVAGAEVAHLKVIGLEEGGAFGVANIVSSGSPAELSVPAKQTAKEMDLIVNARIATDPEELHQHVKQIVSDLCTQLGIVPTFREAQQLRPGRPTPTHRYTKPT